MTDESDAIGYAATVLDRAGVRDYMSYLDLMDDMYCDSTLANRALSGLGYSVHSDGTITGGSSHAADGVGR